MSSPDLVAQSLAAAAAPYVQEAAATLQSRPAAEGSVPQMHAPAPAMDLSSVESAGGVVALSRAAIAEGAGGAVDSKRTLAITRAGAALDSDAVFSDARQRIERVFRLNVILLLTLALLLLVGIGGAIYSALFLDQNTWTLVFGGVAVADLIGIYVFKPITAINRALVSTQQLDMLYLRLREGLRGCDTLADVNEKLACRDKVWDKVWEDLSALNEIA